MLGKGVPLPSKHHDYFVSTRQKRLDGSVRLVRLTRMLAPCCDDELPWSCSLDTIAQGGVGDQAPKENPASSEAAPGWSDLWPQQYGDERITT